MVITRKWLVRFTAMFFTVREYDGLFKIALMFDRKKIPNAILSKANLR